MMSEFWGRVHFWLSLIFMNLIFQPMFAQGMAGMLRRMADGGANYSQARVQGAIGGLSPGIMGLHTYILWAAVGLALAQIPFIINLFWSIKNGKPAGSDNPWEATTLEWQTPTPPPHGNFAKPPEVHRGPYEYSVPGHARDFTPQNQAGLIMDIPYTVQPREDTGLYNAKVGIWLFLASEVMLFGALFSSYILLRVGAPEGYWPRGWLNVPLGTVNTLVLITSSITTVMAWASCKMNQFGRFKVFHACTLLLALTFVCIKSYEYHDKFTHYEITLKDGRIADGHIVENNPKAESVVISGRYVKDRKDLYDLEVRKAPHHHEEITIPRSQIADDGDATAPGTTLTWRSISP